LRLKHDKAPRGRRMPRYELQDWEEVPSFSVVIALNTVS